MNSYELQYVLLGHLAGVLTFELFAFDRDSLVGSGQCPTKTETHGYAAYQMMADDIAAAVLLVAGFTGSFLITGYRTFQKRNRSAFDLVNLVQHVLLLFTFVRQSYTFRDMKNAGPFPTEIFQCKTVMQMALTHLGQLCIQVFTMLLLNHFAYEETQRNVNKDKKRALTMYMLNYTLVGFVSGYYWVYSVIFDRLTLLGGLITLPKVVGLQHTYSAVLTSPPVFLLAAPLALMWSMMLTVIRWSIWRSRIEVAAFALSCCIGAAMVFDYLVISHDTLTVEVTDMHTSREMLGFFRITAVSHWLIAFALCPALCLTVARSQKVNDSRLHELRYVGKELKPPHPIIPSETRGGKAVKAA